MRNWTCVILADRLCHRRIALEMGKDDKLFDWLWVEPLAVWWRLYIG